MKLCHMKHPVINFEPSQLDYELKSCNLFSATHPIYRCIIHFYKAHGIFPKYDFAKMNRSNSKGSQNASLIYFECLFLWNMRGSFTVLQQKKQKHTKLHF